MISKRTIQGLKKAHRDTRFILGARLRAVKEIREQVLSDPGEYQEVYGPRVHSKDPSPLKVKEVRIADRRYIVCCNEEQVRKDRGDREAIVGALRDRLKRGDKSLIGNKGYRKFLKTAGKRFEIDEEKVGSEARFDGLWVLQSDAELPPADTALKYKELWMVESMFRSLKSVLETRPVYHKCDETICGHVFCSFLALVLLKELQARMGFRRGARGERVEWEYLKRDLDALEEITVNNASLRATHRQAGQRFVIRSGPRGDAAKALQAAGVALGPTVRFCP